MSAHSRGGITVISLDGSVLEAKGDWTYNLGKPKRDAIVGTNKVTGYKTTVQVPYIEGAITDSKDFDHGAFLEVTGATITLQLASGKIVTGNDMWYAGEGSATTGEGEISVRFECEQELEEL